MRKALYIGEQWSKASPSSSNKKTLLKKLTKAKKGCDHVSIGRAPA
jgi:hypothetical protein